MAIFSQQVIPLHIPTIHIKLKQKMVELSWPGRYIHPRHLPRATTTFKYVNTFWAQTWKVYLKKESTHYFCSCTTNWRSSTWIPPLWTYPNDQTIFLLLFIHVLFTVPPYPIDISISPLPNHLFSQEFCWISHRLSNTTFH